MVSEKTENQEEIITTHTHTQSSEVWFQFSKFKGTKKCLQKKIRRKKKINHRHIRINSYDFGGA